MADIQKTLLDLPPSIRLHIYGFAGLASDHVIPLDRRHRVEEQVLPYTYARPDRTLNLQLADLALSSALQLVCRTIHDEVSHHLYSANTFIAHDLRTLGSLGPSYLASLTSLKLIPCLTMGAGPHRGCACTPLQFLEESLTLDASTLQGRATLWDWHSTAGKIAPHLTASRLDLTLLCPVQGEATAELLVAPLRRLPLLSSCHIRLSHLNRRKYAIQMIAANAARLATGQLVTSNNTALPLLDLPREIRLLILEHTDLTTPLNTLEWDPDGGYRFQPTFCHPGSKYTPAHEPCHPEFHTGCALRGSLPCRLCPSSHPDRPHDPANCWRCQQLDPRLRQCDTQRADGANLGLSCCAAQASAYSPSCTCWTPPVALFGVCRVLRREAQQIFFSQNAFSVPKHRPYAYASDATSAPDRCTASVFLTDVVPGTMLPLLNRLTLSLWDCVSLAARTDWMRAARRVARVSRLRFLILDTSLGFGGRIQDAMPDEADGYRRESGLVAVREVVGASVWPLETVGTDAVRQLVVDAGCSRYPTNFTVYYSYRRVEERGAVLVSSKRIAGDNYSVVRGCEGLHIFRISYSYAGDESGSE